ncbi:MAG: hypothetical protein FWH26_05745 [Oscillospiraceae bacterium]|nr:hypothetical protein [Oscillospiraceae bacterium]
MIDAYYADKFTMKAKWLFITLLRVPGPEKKPKKKKKEKPKKEKKPGEEPEGPKEPGAFARFYQNEGLAGFMELLRRLMDALRKFGRGVQRSILIRKFDLQIVVTGGDPQELAEKYGKACAAVFPVLGWFNSHLRVRRGGKGHHRIDIHPDFTGWDKKQLQCGAVIAISPLRLVAAVLALAARLIVRVLLRFLKGARQGREQKQDKQNININLKETAS